MIATHDTFTYCKCKNPVINLFKRWWRCQDIHVTGQIRRGAGYLDVRIRYKAKDSCEIVICHGLADMNGLVFKRIENLLQYLEKFNVMYRLIFERGSTDEELLFEYFIETHKDEYPHLMWAVIKRGWKEIFVRKGHPKIVDLCLHWDRKTILKSFFKDVVKENSDKITVTQDMIDNKDTVYFLDYWKGCI